MPTNTPNLKIPKPLGSETVSRASLNTIYDTIDANVVALPTFGSTRQAIINGGFTINQRGKTGTVVLTAGNYGHDRWRAGSSGCTYTFATVSNVTTITITAGSLVQSIEGINLISGTYTLSWSGTALGKIGAGSTGGSGITGTVTGGTNIAVEFFVGTISKVQFNAGDVALPFQPRSFGDELALCQRYYEKSYQQAISPGSISTLGATSSRVQAAGSYTVSHTVEFKVVKRTTPTVTVYSPSTGVSGKWRVNATNVDASIYNPSEGRFTSFATQAWVQNDDTEFQWTADAEF